MKPILFSFFIASGIISASAQTTAQDWTKTDCSGTNHTLYTYLDNQDVVVMEFIMGCSSCSDAGLVLEHMKQSFDVSNPGKVHFFAMDYESTHSCSADITPFMTAAGLTYPAFDHCLAEKNYYTSTSPMPMIVVASGSNHSIVYIKNSFVSGTSDSLDIYNSIAGGITTAGINEAGKTSALNVFPTLADEFISIGISSSVSKNATCEIYNSLGERVFTHVVENSNVLKINTSDFKNGIYFIQLMEENNKKTAPQKFVISR